MEEFMTVGRLAKKVGLSPKSVRYYEKEGLLPKARRSPAGYRLYGADMTGRLQFIQKAKAIGFGLQDIRSILELTDRGKPCCERVFEWSGKRIQELDDQIRFLSALKEKLAYHRKSWEGRIQPSKIPVGEMCRLIGGVELAEARK